MGYTHLDKKQWKLADIIDYSVGQWEPNLDKQLWKDKRELHIFSQNVSQADGEGLLEIEPQMVRVIELKKLPAN